MKDGDHRRALSKAWAEALNELRHRHDAEFHLILSSRYEALGLDVTKRQSRIAIKINRLNAARALIEESQTPQP